MGGGAAGVSFRDGGGVYVAKLPAGGADSVAELVGATGEGTVPAGFDSGLTIFAALSGLVPFDDGAAPPLALCFVVAPDAR